MYVQAIFSKQNKYNNSGGVEGILQLQAWRVSILFFNSKLYNNMQIEGDGYIILEMANDEKENVNRVKTDTL